MKYCNRIDLHTSFTILFSLRLLFDWRVRNSFGNTMLPNWFERLHNIVVGASCTAGSKIQL